MKYYCEVCGKTFESEDKCLDCEKRHQEEKARREKLRQEKDERWAEVQEAYKKAKELHNQFDKDYADIHNSYWMKVPHFLW